MANRRYERLPVNQRVTVNFPDREALFEMYLKDISRGGVFVETDQPFSLRDKIEIILEVEGAGSLVLLGEVVHAVNKEQAGTWGSMVGVGVQFFDLDADKRDLLESYLDGIRNRLDDELKAAPFDTTLIEQVEKANRKGDLLTVLGVDLKCDSVQIQVAVETRTEVMSSLLKREGLSGALKKRIIAARLALQRAGAMLADDRKRAGYLLRSQALEPEELAEYLMDMPAVWTDMQHTWDSINPAVAPTSRRLEQLAKEAAASGDREGALKSAQLALKQHPFLFELRMLKKEWERDS